MLTVDTFWTRSSSLGSFVALSTSVTQRCSRSTPSELALHRSEGRRRRDFSTRVSLALSLCPPPWRNDAHGRRRDFSTRVSLALSLCPPPWRNDAHGRHLLDSLFIAPKLGGATSAVEEIRETETPKARRDFDRTHRGADGPESFL
eukprot:scaffold69_cov248-Pinguiococcus_pyrenoidosus.AAC.66